MQTVLFAGCVPEVAAFDGRIIAVGAGARSAAGRRAEVIRLRGEAWPGLIDSHIHLEGLADKKLTVDLTGARDLREALARIKDWAREKPKDGWVAGSGWYNDAWPEAAFPNRSQLDGVAGKRPAFMRRKDGHSAWVSGEALKRAGIDRPPEDRAGGRIDRDESAEPTGILRETAMSLVADVIPRPADADLDRAMARVLAEMARFGLTSVHSMDSARGFATLQRLHSRGRLPVRVTYNLPLSDLPHAERMGVRSGWGDEWLRFWGVKAFLDGSLGSRTGEMRVGQGAAEPGRPARHDPALRPRRAQRVLARHRRWRRAARRRRAGPACQRLEWVAAAHRARAVRQPERHAADGASRDHRVDAAGPRGGGP